MSLQVSLFQLVWSKELSNIHLYVHSLCSQFDIYQHIPVIFSCGNKASFLSLIFKGFHYTLARPHKITASTLEIVLSHSRRRFLVRTSVRIFLLLYSWLTHFMPLVSFDSPWKPLVFWCFDVFREYQKRPVAWNGLSGYKIEQEKLSYWVPHNLSRARNLILFSYILFFEQFWKFSVNFQEKNM